MYTEGDSEMRSRWRQYAYLFSSCSDISRPRFVARLLVESAAAISPAHSPMVPERRLCWLKARYPNDFALYG